MQIEYLFSHMWTTKTSFIFISLRSIFSVVFVYFFVAFVRVSKHFGNTCVFGNHKGKEKYIVSACAVWREERHHQRHAFQARTMQRIDKVITKDECFNLCILFHRVSQLYLTVRHLIMRERLIATTQESARDLIKYSFTLKLYIYNRLQVVMRLWKCLFLPYQMLRN